MTKIFSAKGTAIISGLLVAFTPHQVNAENSMCDSEIELELLVGDYLMALNHTVLFGEGKVLPLSARDAIPIKLDVVAGSLAIIAGGEVILFDALSANNQDWTDEDTQSFALSPGAMATEIACSYNDLPRFIGSGVSQSQEGSVIYYTYRLVAFSELEGNISFAGSLVWDDDGTMEMVRTVSITPN